MFFLFFRGTFHRQSSTIWCALGTSIIYHSRILVMQTKGTPSGGSDNCEYVEWVMHDT